MTDIRFSRVPASANELCQRDPETLQQFLRCNPEVANGKTTMPGHFAYSASYTSGMDSRNITQQFNSLPISSREHLDNCVADYGEDVLALAEFHERHIAGFELPASPQNVNGLAGVGIAAAQGRTTSFQNALLQYQSALVKLNNYTRTGRVASGRRVELRRDVTNAYERLNTHFQQEMKRVVPAGHRNRNRGSALSNSERGITLAERSRGRGIHIADMHEGQKVSRFAKALRHTGRGLIAVDVGFRGAEVRRAYNSDDDWKREIAVQTGGLTGAGLSGLTAGRLTFAMSRVALAATPVGWGVLIGSSVVMGGILAYQLDKQGQNIIGTVWDKIFGN